MDVILEGKLSREHRIEELLQTILNMKKQVRGILRISCPDHNIEGRLSLSNNEFIVGAAISSTGESGYAAVKKLLSSSEASYALLDPGPELPAEDAQALHISIGKLLSFLPDFPDKPTDLFDEEALLDEVFGPSARKSAEVPLPEHIKERETASAEKNSPPLWAVLNPLLGDTPPPNSHLSTDHKRTESSRSGAQFKALKSHDPEKKKIIEFIVWLVVLIAVLAVCIFLFDKMTGPAAGLLIGSRERKHTL